MMKFVRRQEVEINEKRLAEDLSDYFYDVLAYQDVDFAEDFANGDYGNYELQKLAILNQIGQVWHEEFLKKIVDCKITSEKEIFG